MKKLLITAVALLSIQSAFAEKSYLTSIGELCESSNGCEIEIVKKNMKINLGNRSLLVLNSKYEYIEGECKKDVPCKIVVKKL